MPVVITYTGATPTVDADEDVWGDELNNDALAPIKADLDALASQGNASEPLAAGALPKAGGTMTGDIVLASSGPSNTYSGGYRGTPIVNITGNKTLALSDAGTKQVMGGSFTATVTIPPIASVGLASHAIAFRNTSPNPITIARGTGVVLRLAGSPVDKNITISQWGSAVLTNDGGDNWSISGINIA